MNLCSEKHMWEITESGEFCDIHCYLQCHCRHWCGWGLGTYLHNIIFHWFTPQRDRRRRRVVHSHRSVEMYPPPHPHSLTRLCSDLNFWIQKVKVLENSTSGSSTTSRHPLGEIGEMKPNNHSASVKLRNSCKCLETSSLKIAIS